MLGSAIYGDGFPACMFLWPSSLAAWCTWGSCLPFPRYYYCRSEGNEDYSGTFCDYIDCAQRSNEGFFANFWDRVSGSFPSKNFIPFWEDLNGERFYLMFQWGHLADYIYAWASRSWIYWPTLFGAALLFGWRSFLHPERLFLLLYTLGFTFFTLTWHPNLGIHQDWDLFALEAAPFLLLLITYLPNLVQSPFRGYSWQFPS
jgi:hypothetical protein